LNARGEGLGDAFFEEMEHESTSIAAGGAMERT
jgi:hypothetical protein